MGSSAGKCGNVPCKYDADVAGGPTGSWLGGGFARSAIICAVHYQCPGRCFDDCRSSRFLQARLRADARQDARLTSRASEVEWSSAKLVVTEKAPHNSLF